MSPAVTQLSWTNHLVIMSGCKSDEEREFYMRLAIKERYSKRELERQMDSGYFERYMLSKEKLLPEKIKSELNPFDIVNNGWHIYLKDICTYATLSKAS